MAVLPSWLISICGLCALIAVSISLAGIHLQLKNYRKPHQQRLVVRIQLMIPLFALSCYVALRWYRVSQFLEPIREIYEAFVIYTFFSLLTHLLGGERNIVVVTSGREPVSQPLPFSKLFPKVDVSDPFTLLSIKRGVLQYVWLKPFLCLMFAAVEVFDLGDGYLFFTNLAYNISVTVSLYDLALFWKCLYQDLKPFNPWGKFLCVKLIIFASYWQGVILGILSWSGVLKTGGEGGGSLGFAIQNALLCVELIGFAVGHWHSFSWTEYSPEALPGCGRLSYTAALKDVFGCGDLIYDFKMTFSGDSYDYRQFDSVEALIAHPSSASRMARFNQGLRFTEHGKQRYWLPNAKTPLLQGQHAQGHRARANSSTSTTNASTRAIYAGSILTVDSKDHVSSYNAIEQDEEVDELLQGYVKDEEVYNAAKRERPYGDKNYPVIYDTQEHTHSPALQRLRREAMARQQCM